MTLVTGAFEAGRFAHALAAARGDARPDTTGGAALGDTLFVLDRVRSTQEEARALMRRGAPHGTIVLAEEQTEGRGRRGRTWSSPRGAGIWATVILRRGLREGTPQGLTLAAAVAVCEAARSLGADVAIKWPNDVIAARGKVAGILGEMLGAGPGPGPSALLGLGVNYDWGGTELPPEIVAEATDLRVSGLRSSAHREDVLAAIVVRLDDAVSRAGDGRFAEVLEEWRRLSPSSSGRRVSVLDLAGDPLTGTTRGIASDGSLLVEDDAGGTHIVRFGGTIRFQAPDAEEHGCS